MAQLRRHSEFYWTLHSLIYHTYPSGLTSQFHNEIIYKKNAYRTLKFLIQFIYTKLLSVLKMLTLNKQPLHKWTHINKLPLPHRVISERDHFTSARLLLTRIYYQV